MLHSYLSKKSRRDRTGGSAGGHFYGFAGPWLDDEGDMRGSLLIVDADTLETVENWLEQDPYNKANLTGF